MPTTSDIYWTTDSDTFLSLPGGQEVADWFGFVPSFHDATLEKLELGEGQASILIRAFRMTDEVDDKGYFILNRYALVEIQLFDVTGVSLKGNATSCIAGLGIRQISSAPGEWITCDGPKDGNFEVGWDTSIGLEGAIYAKRVSLALR